MNFRRPPNLVRRPVMSPPGFTLMELMVSIALVLIIILGVNTVFRITSDTVNAGMALSAADRENRGIQAVLSNDMQTGVFTDGPCLIIRSERQAAFRSVADAAGDRDGLPLTLDLDGDNVENEANVPGEAVPLPVFNSRNHRLDRLMFFANHLFRRQTGYSGSFVDDETSNEAYIYYSHLRQPNNATANIAGNTNSATGVQLFNPGEVNRSGQRNDNNLFATDWILGRSVVLLRDTPLGALTGTHNFIVNTPSTPSRPNLTPLSPPSESGDNQRLTWSRYDVAQTSTDAFRLKLADFIPWTGNLPERDRWWNVMSDERFVGYPYPDRPLSPYRAAWAAPVFVRGCTQFIVEYAGDYLRQNPETGEIDGTYLAGVGGTDGQVDFLLSGSSHLPPASDIDPMVRRVRWYGFPRNVDTSDDVGGVRVVGTSGNLRDFRDVVPLRDILATEGIDLDDDHSFEHFSPGFRSAPNYAAPGAMPADARYNAAWGPGDLARGSLSRPKMLRITVVVDDPNGRLGGGQTYEYVLDLP
jgi:prepilin-type N-terminal cleavage/methylation domain-containing protein